MDDDEDTAWLLCSPDFIAQNLALKWSLRKNNHLRSLVHGDQETHHYSIIDFSHCHTSAHKVLQLIR